MKVLHLYSNYKWTGPADLALLQAQALVQHEAQIDLRFAIADWTGTDERSWIGRRAEELGLPTCSGLELRRHYHLPSLLRDAQTLSRWIEDEGIELLHCHQAGDHFLAALAKSWCSRPVAIVRSFWERRLPPRVGRMLFAYQHTDALLGPFATRTEGLGARFDLPAASVTVVPPILDAAFRPGSTDELAAARAELLAELGAAGDDFVVGLTARIQKRRRWDLAWDCTLELVRAWPGARLCVLGRPDEGVFDEVCARPVAERGLGERVHFLGYRAGAAYRRALLGFDAFLFLVPGSDATCRALREAMACGLPAVVTDEPPLPEIATHGESAAICRPEAGELAAELLRLAADPAFRARRAQDAQRGAARGTDPESQARILREVYDRARKSYP